MDPTARPGPEDRAGLLARAAVIGMALYVALDVVAQLLPPHYSPVHQAESDLGVGPYGWIMSLNFVVRGALAAAAAAAIARAFPRDAGPTAGIALLWLFAICSALLAVFPTDILDDRALVPHPVASMHGEVHLVLAAIAFFAAPIGALLTSFALQRSPALAPWRPTAITAAVLAALALLLMPTFARVHHAGGLGERLFLFLTLLWFLVLALGIHSVPGGPARRNARPAARPI